MISRRDFFSAVIGKKNIETTLSQNQISSSQRTKNTTEGLQLYEYTLIGHMTQFVVGTTTYLDFADTILVIESLPEGIRATLQDSNRAIALKLENNGQIYGQSKTFWPTNAVLSILTGEIYNI